MAGITGMGTTFNLPNYVGELFAISPEDTPFLTAIGGLTGGRVADAALFTWSTYDLRDADAGRQALEGANAPTAEARVRGTGHNVLEIHHEAIDISYSKKSFTGQYASTGSANSQQVGVSGSNPVLDEEAFQIEVALKQIARDVAKGFIQGQFANPADNSSPRKTRGLSQAIATNVTQANNAALTEAMVLDTMQLAWEQGGLAEGETRTIICNALQKRRLTKIFITDKGYIEASRNVGGVNLQTFETDFGKCNIMLDRYAYTDEVLFVSLEECAPRFAEVPGKGFLFVEDLAKIGSSDRKQIYGEIGLEYGLETHHAKIANLNTASGS